MVDIGISLHFVEQIAANIDMHNFINLFNLTSITGQSKFKAIVALVVIEGGFFTFQIV